MAVHTRRKGVSGRMIWEWGTVLVFVGLLAAAIVWASNPDGTVEIISSHEGYHVWGIDEIIDYDAECVCSGEEGHNTGFDETAGLTQTDGYDDDAFANVSGTLSDTGVYTLEAECPETGLHGEPVQNFKVVELIDMLVDDESAVTSIATPYMSEVYPENIQYYAVAPSGYVYVEAVLSPEVSSSELRPNFLVWKVASGDTTPSQLIRQISKTVPSITGSLAFMPGVAQPSGPCATEMGTVVSIVQVDLDLADVDDEDEEGVGGFAVVGENTPMTLDVDPNSVSDSAEVMLTWNQESDTKIEVYKDSARTNQIHYDSNNTWDPQDIEDSATVYIVGTTADENVKDVQFSLQFWNPNKNECVHSDTVTVTVTRLDLKANSIEENEEETIGAFVGINDDDSDEDGIVDKDDDFVGLDGLGYPKENRLGNLTLSWFPVPPDDPEEYSAQFLWQSEVDICTGNKSGTVTGNGTTLDPSDFPLTPYLEGDVVSESFRDVALTLSCWRDSDKLHCDTVNVTVIKLGISIIPAIVGDGFQYEYSGLPEDVEEYPGAFLGLNNDDDDGDGVLDNVDTNGVACGDDELSLLYLTGQPSGIELCTRIRIDLDWEAWDDTELRWFEDIEMTDEIILELEPAFPWSLYEFYQMDPLYVEGNVASSSPPSGTLRLYASFGSSIYGGTYDDAITTTVLQVDAEVDEQTEQEEELDGGFVAFNRDDDDSDGITDYLDSNGTNNEDDLIEVTLTALPGDNYCETPDFVAISWNDGIVPWTDSNRNTMLESAYGWGGDTLPTTVYVEGTSPSVSPRDKNLVLSYRIIRDGWEYVKHADIIPFTVVDVTLDAPSAMVESDTQILEANPYPLLSNLGEDDDGCLYWSLIEGSDPPPEVAFNPSSSTESYSTVMTATAAGTGFVKVQYCLEGVWMSDSKPITITSGE